MSEIFKFRSLAIDDCISSNLHHPKIDNYEDHFFLIVHGINYHSKSNVVDTTELAISETKLRHLWPQRTPHHRGKASIAINTEFQYTSTWPNYS